MASKDDAIRKLVWETTRSLVMELDAALRITRVSRGFAELLGKKEADLLGRSLLEFIASLEKYETDRVFKERRFERTIQTLHVADGAKNFMAALERTDDGAVFFAEPLYASETTAERASAPKDDSSKALQELEEKNAYLNAVIQRLRKEQVLTSSTGLPKRKMLDQIVESEIARSLRNNRPFALVLCGLDRAQALDQIAGEDARVVAMTVVAKAIAARKRVFDAMGHFSPTELYIVQPENEGKGAKEFSERIRKSLEHRKIHLTEVMFSITLSFGCAYFHATKNHYRNPSEMISQAEAALFFASSTGGNKTVEAPQAAVLAQELEKMP